MKNNVLEKLNRAIVEDHVEENRVATASLSGLYYDGKSFYFPGVNGDPVPVDRASMRQYLISLGFSAEKDDDDVMSEVNALLVRIQVEHYVSWVGRLAGYSAGQYVMNGQRILVIGGPTFVSPSKGSFPLILEVLTNLLGDIQLKYFFSWLQLALIMLKTRTWQPGQALVLCGPKNAGKNLVRELITAALGGRVAQPHGWMTGRTNFNSDVIGSETLAIEDQQESVDIRARRAFGAAIKDVTVNAQQRAERKHCDAVSLEPLRRLIISLNDDPERLQILPPLDNDIEDKIMLFKVQRCKMPMPTNTGALRVEFWAALSAELPMLVHFLEEDWFIPEELSDDRFGVKAYHHPDLVGQLRETTPESHLFEIIHEVLFRSDASSESWSGTASQLEGQLTGEDSRCAGKARKLLSHPNTCGTYLARLEAQDSGVSRVKKNGHTVWTIEKQPHFSAIEAESHRRRR